MLCSQGGAGGWLHWQNMNEVSLAPVETLMRVQIHHWLINRNTLWHGGRLKRGLEGGGEKGESAGHRKGRRGTRMRRGAWRGQQNWQQGGKSEARVRRRKERGWGGGVNHRRGGGEKGEDLKLLSGQGVDKGDVKEVKRGEGTGGGERSRPFFSNLENNECLFSRSCCANSYPSLSTVEHVNGMTQDLSKTHSKNWWMELVFPSCICL